VPLMIGAMGPRMMRLAAQHADIWNVCYTGDADSFAAHLARFKDACRAVNRDLNTVTFTALANVTFTDLGGAPPPPIDDDLPLPDSALNAPLIGSDDEIAHELTRYRELGAAHVMFQLQPYSVESLDRLAGIVARVK